MKTELFWLVGIFVLVGSLLIIKSCRGLYLDELHVGYMGAGFDIAFDHSERAEFQLILPMEKRGQEWYDKVSRELKVHLLAKDSTAVFSLIPEHPIVLVDTVHQNLYISYGYVRDK